MDPIRPVSHDLPRVPPVERRVLDRDEAERRERERRRRRREADADADLPGADPGDDDAPRIDVRA